MHTTTPPMFIDYLPRPKTMESAAAALSELKKFVATTKHPIVTATQHESEARDTVNLDYKSLCQVQDILVKELRDARQFIAQQNHAADEARIEGALAERKRIASRCDELAAEAERNRLSCEDEDWWGGRAYALRLIASELREVKP